MADFLLGRGVVHSPRHRHPDAAAFTLIELMVVVVIIAILTTVAIVAYTRYVRNARVIDGKTFVSAIQARQEAYFQSKGTYANMGTDYYPALTADEPEAKIWTSAGAWLELGAKPESGHTYFEYLVTAGNGTPPSGLEGTGLSSGQPWYYIIARANLDGNGTCPADCTVLTTNSVRTDIIVQNEGK